MAASRNGVSILSLWASAPTICVSHVAVCLLKNKTWQLNEKESMYR